MAVLPGGNAVGLRGSEGFEIVPPSGFTSQGSEGFEIDPPGDLTSQGTEGFEINPPPIADQTITVNPITGEVGQIIGIEGILKTDGIAREGVDIDLEIDGSVVDTKASDVNGKVTFNRTFNTTGVKTAKLVAQTDGIISQGTEDFE